MKSDLELEREMDEFLRLNYPPSPGYKRGVEDAIRIVRERGERIRGAIQPDHTEDEIRLRLNVPKKSPL